MFISTSNLSTNTYFLKGQLLFLDSTSLVDIVLVVLVQDLSSMYQSYNPI